MTEARRASIRFELKIQTVSRPHKVFLKKKMVAPTWDAIENIKKELLADYNRQYPQGEPLEIEHRFISYK